MDEKFRYVAMYCHVTDCYSCHGLTIHFNDCLIHLISSFLCLRIRRNNVVDENSVVYQSSFSSKT